MTKWFKKFIELIGSQLVGDEEVQKLSSIPSLLDSVDKARQDWLTAKAYFDNVTDPDLVDHAIYGMDATEKKYVYLLKQARAEGLNYKAPTGQLINTSRTYHH